MTTKNKRPSGKRLWIPLVVAALLIAASAGYLVWRSQSQPANITEASPYQTSQVTRGNISRSASGSGSLVAGSEAALSFPVAGTIARVNVSVGDKVSKGEELAALEDIQQLKTTVETRNIAVNTAQKAVDEITQNADLTLARAEITLADAQAALADAQDNLLTKGQERCNDQLTSKYYYQYLDVQKLVDFWQGELDGDSKYGRDYILEHLNPLKKQRNTAYANWAYCNAYTDQEVAASQAGLQLAKANLGLAQTNLEKMKESGGIDKIALALAQANVRSAQAELTVAENNLNAAVITAPMDGTVLSITAGAGEEVGTGTFITLADLDHPAIQLSVDESDLQNIGVGCSVSVSFDSVPNRSFEGTVSEINPQLVTASGFSAIQALVKLTSPTLSGQPTLPIGLDASAEVICGEANNVLLIPVEALHQLADGSSVVYVLNAEGQPEQRAVETGMQDYTNVEITSGLQDGEQVITQGPGIPG